MDSYKEALESTVEVEDQQHSPNDDPIPIKCHKDIWKQSPDSETYHTIVVNYHSGQRWQNISAIPKHREAWTQMVASMIVPKDLKVESDVDVYNLRGMFRLACNNTENDVPSSTLCEPSTSNNRKTHGRHHRMKFEIFKRTPVHLVPQASKDIENSASTSKSAINRELRTDACTNGRQANNKHVITHIVEILNLPLLHEAKTEYKLERNIEMSPEFADVIIISSDEEDKKSAQTKISEVEMSQDIRMESVKHNSTKSTQKPEAFIEATPQTVKPVAMVQRLLQIPSSSSSVHSNSVLQPSRIPSTRKQRQLVLHHLRVQVETKRLELLEMILNRERNAMKRDQRFSDGNESEKKTIFKELDDENDV